MKTAGKALTLLAVIGLAVPAVAHHAWPVNMNELVTVQGTVTDFRWANPHPMIALDVTLADGSREEWQIGGPAINRMEAKGWNKDTVKTGDTITGVGYQFTDGQKIIRLETITFADGREMKLYAR